MEGVQSKFSEGCQFLFLTHITHLDGLSCHIFSDNTSGASHSPVQLCWKYFSAWEILVWLCKSNVAFPFTSISLNVETGVGIMFVSALSYFTVLFSYTPTIEMCSFLVNDFSPFVFIRTILELIYYCWFKNTRISQLNF